MSDTLFSSFSCLFSLPPAVNSELSLKLEKKMCFEDHEGASRTVDTDKLPSTAVLPSYSEDDFFIKS